MHVYTAYINIHVYTNTLHITPTAATTTHNSSHVRFSPSGRHLLAGSLDSALRLWSVASPSKCVKTYRCGVRHRMID